jgi:protein-disulfide isomerase
VFADVECPTVRRFVLSYLPSIVATWVRTGAVKLEYLSLQTDTVNEHTFFKQETAALAAGRQNRMWNYLLTFVHEQGQEFTDYATDRFLVDIASQIPGLELTKWRRDWRDPLLLTRVALNLQAGSKHRFSYTPSFSLAYTSGQVDQRIDKATVRRELAASLNSDLRSLSEEAAREGSKDIPTLGPFKYSARGN